MLPIYIISLAKDINKRNVIEEKLNRLNIPFEFLDAIYGKDLDRKIIDNLNCVGKIVDRGFGPTYGEVGCSLSHLKAYTHVIQRSQEWACILEDDAILDERFLNFYKNFSCERHNLDVENLYLLGGQDGINDSRFIAKSFFTHQNIGINKFYKTIKSEKFIFRTCCYLISIELAEKITILYGSKFILADDWEYLVKKGIIRDIYLSNFVSHPIDLNLSTIQKEREDGRASINKGQLKNNFILKFLRYPFNKVKNLCKIFFMVLRRFNK